MVEQHIVTLVQLSFTLQALLTDTNEIPQSLSSVQVSNALIKLKTSLVCFHIDIIKPL